MNFLLIGLAGILGTSAMIGALLFIHRMKWANVDMIRALGSLYTHSYQQSFIPGLVIHYTFGLVFSLLYAMIADLTSDLNLGNIITMTALSGLIHGIFFGCILESWIAEHHPLERFQQVGLSGIAAQIAGHTVYGLCVGAFFSLVWDQIQFTIDNYVRNGIIGDFISYSIVWLPLFGPPIFLAGYLIYNTLHPELRSETKILGRHHRSEKRHFAHKGISKTRTKMAA